MVQAIDVLKIFAYVVIGMMDTVGCGCRHTVSIFEFFFEIFKLDVMFLLTSSVISLMGLQRQLPVSYSAAASVHMLVACTLPL